MGGTKKFVTLHDADGNSRRRDRVETRSNDGEGATAYVRTHKYKNPEYIFLSPNVYALTDNCYTLRLHNNLSLTTLNKKQQSELKHESLTNHNSVSRISLTPDTLAKPPGPPGEDVYAAL